MSLPEPYWQSDDGRLTLYCADACDVLPRLPDGAADMVWTDPPYGHRNNDDDLIARWEAALGRPPGALPAEPRPIAGDGPEANDLFRWALPHMRRLLKGGGCCCCCGGGGPDPQFARWSLWMDEVFRFKQMVIWDKGPMGMGWHYRRSYETVLVGEVPGAACRWYDETNKAENIVRHIPKVIPQAADHPTAKPVALAEHFIALHTRPGDVVLDPFAGGGTAMRAAANLGRRFVGIEIEERWCRLAVARMRQHALPLFAEAAG